MDVAETAATLESVTTTGSDVISVWWFSTDDGAQRASHRLDASRNLAVQDGCIVSWPAGQQRPSAWQTAGFGSSGRLAGAFWGLVVSWLFLLPISHSTGQTTSRSADSRGTDPAGVTGGVDVADGLRGGLGHLGFDTTFAGTVRTQVVPGTSAIFLLCSADDSLRLPAAMSRTARCIARHELSSNERERLHAGFDD